MRCACCLPLPRHLPPLQLKDFDEKVISKTALLVDRFGAGECLAMMDRIEEVLKGKVRPRGGGGRWLEASVSERG